MERTRKVFANYNELASAFAQGKVQPKGLKDSMIIHITPFSLKNGTSLNENDIIAP